jgi:hypothetical protein
MMTPSEMIGLFAIGSLVRTIAEVLAQPITSNLTRLYLKHSVTGDAACLRGTPVAS